MSNFLKKGLVVQDGKSIQVFCEKDVIYRSESIPEYFFPTCYNIKAAYFYDFEINTPHPLEIINLDVDVVIDDDTKELPVTNSFAFGRNSVSLGFIKNGKMYKQINFTTHENEDKKAGLILHPGEVIRVLSEKDLNALTFTCRKIYANEPQPLKQLGDGVQAILN